MPLCGHSDEVRLVRSRLLGIMALACFGMQLLLPLDVNSSRSGILGVGILYGQVTSPFAVFLQHGHDMRSAALAFGWALADGVVAFLAFQLSRRKYQPTRKSIAVIAVLGIGASIAIQLSHPDLGRIYWGSGVKYLGFVLLIYGVVMRNGIVMLPTPKPLMSLACRRGRKLAIAAFATYLMQVACPVYQPLLVSDPSFGIEILLSQIVGPLMIGDKAPLLFLWAVVDGLFIFIVMRVIRGVVHWHLVWLPVIFFVAVASSVIPWVVFDLQAHRLGASIRYTSFVLAIVAVGCCVFRDGSSTKSQP